MLKFALKFFFHVMIKALTDELSCTRTGLVLYYVNRTGLRIAIVSPCILNSTRTSLQIVPLLSLLPHS